MASVKEIRNRVKSVNNTKKITRAMKLVAAAKLRRAQDAVVAARPYSSKMREVIGALVAEVDADSHPLFQAAETPRTCLIIPMTSDRGLCGAFNSSVTRRTERMLREQAEAYDTIEVAAIGRKGRAYSRRRELTASVDLEGDVTGANHASAAALVQTLIQAFLETEVDEIYLIFNEFQSALTQNVVVEQLLPLSPDALASGHESASDDDLPNLVERIYEPGKEEVLDALLPRYLESQILRALLESQASEMGARMTAMDNATRNASELIDKLTLVMNRARQAIITTELMEITSGSEALKG